MRKLKLQMQLSVDGFCAGPNGEMDWMTWNFTDDISKYISALNKNVDCILMGRKLAEGFIPHWAAEATDPAKKRDFIEKISELDYDFATKMHETPKIVFSKSLKSAGDWQHTSIAEGNLVSEIKRLKKQRKGGDIMVYGGSAFVSSLIQKGLIDEYHFFINPAILGKGMPIFKKRTTIQALELVKSTAFENGIVTNVYKPK